MTTTQELLREAQEASKHLRNYTGMLGAVATRLHNTIDAALAAPAPAAEPKDERAAFEAAFPLAASQWWGNGYHDPMYTYALVGWKARAALAAAPQPAEPNRYVGLTPQTEQVIAKFIEPAAPAATVPDEPSKRDEAYDQIDRFLRNNLSDMDYADYSQALDLVWAAPAATVPAEPEGVAEVIQWVKAIRNFNIAHRGATQGQIEDFDSILSKLENLAAPAATVQPALTDEQIKAERERCAKLCDDWKPFSDAPKEIERLAAAIRNQEASPAPRDGGGWLRAAARDFYNLTVADQEVIIRAPSAEKRDAIKAAGERLRALLAASGAPDDEEEAIRNHGQEPRT